MKAINRIRKYDVPKGFQPSDLAHRLCDLSFPHTLPNGVSTCVAVVPLPNGASMTFKFLCCGEHRDELTNADAQGMLPQYLTGQVLLGMRAEVTIRYKDGAYAVLHTGPNA